MKKTTLGVAIVVVFCITFWMVAGEAWQASQKAEQAIKQAEQALQAYEQAAEKKSQAEQAYEQAAEKEEQGISARVYATQLAAKKAKQAYQQAKEAAEKAEQAYQEAIVVGIDPNEAKFSAKEATESFWNPSTWREVLKAPQKAKQAMADAHWRTQGSWGIGAGLLADVLLLVGALAWSKLTAKA